MINFDLFLKIFLLAKKIEKQFSQSKNYSSDLNLIFYIHTQYQSNGEGGKETNFNSIIH